MANARLDLEMSVTQGREVRRVLQGVVKDTTRAEHDIRRVYRQTEAGERVRGNRRVSFLRRIARRGVRIVEQAERMKRRMFRETGREMRRSMQTSMKESGRDMRGFISRNKFEIAAGVIAGVYSADRRAQSFVNLPTNQESFQSAIEVRKNLVSLQNELNLSNQQRDVIENQILEVGEKWGQSAEVMTEMALSAQTKFSNLELFTENADAFAEFAFALNTSPMKVQNAIGEFVRQMGVETKDIPKVLGILKESVALGSIEIDDFTEHFSASIGLFKRAFDVTPERAEQGTREAIALIEALGGGGENAPETETKFKALVRDLNDPEVRKSVWNRGRGFRVTAEKGGRLLPIDIIMDRLLADPRFQGEGGQAALQEMFPNLRSAGGAGILLDTLRRDPEFLRTIINADSGAGEASIRRGAETRRSQDFGARRNIEAIKIQNDMIRNAAEVSDLALEITAPMRELSAKHPIATEALGVARDAAIAAGGVHLLRDMAGGRDGDGEEKQGWFSKLIGARSSSMKVPKGLKLVGAAGAAYGAYKLFEFVQERNASATEANTTTTDENTRALHRLSSTLADGPMSREPNQSIDPGVTR